MLSVHALILIPALSSATKLVHLRFHRHSPVYHRLSESAESQGRLPLSEASPSRPQMQQQQMKPTEKTISSMRSPPVSMANIRRDSVLSPQRIDAEDHRLVVGVALSSASSDKSSDKSSGKSSVHRQASEKERGERRATGLARHRATAAAAKVAHSASTAAFPSKDPARRKLVVAGERMVDIRVGHLKDSCVKLMKVTPFILFASSMRIILLLGDMRLCAGLSC